MMKWTTERSTMFASLMDVYDDDGNILAKDKTIERASLIASAPEMLEALKEVDRYFDNLFKSAILGKMRKYISMEEIDARNIIKHAIAKAEGGGCPICSRKDE